MHQEADEAEGMVDEEVVVEDTMVVVVEEGLAAVVEDIAMTDVMEAINNSSIITSSRGLLRECHLECPSRRTKAKDTKAKVKVSTTTTTIATVTVTTATTTVTTTTMVHRKAGYLLHHQANPSLRVAYRRLSSSSSSISIRRGRTPTVEEGTTMEVADREGNIVMIPAETGAEFCVGRARWVSQHQFSCLEVHVFFFFFFLSFFTFWAVCRTRFDLDAEPQVMSCYNYVTQCDPKTF